MEDLRVCTNLTILSCKCLTPLFSKIRDRRTSSNDFARYSRRLMKVICEEGLACIDPLSVDIITPTNSSYIGKEVNEENLVAISIIRAGTTYFSTVAVYQTLLTYDAGDSMLESLLSCVPYIPVGKLLIQRNEETSEPIFYYKKFPTLEGKKVILLDPMLG